MFKERKGNAKGCEKRLETELGQIKKRSENKLINIKRRDFKGDLGGKLRVVQNAQRRSIHKKKIKSKRRRRGIKRKIKSRSKRELKKRVLEKGWDIRRINIRVRQGRMCMYKRLDGGLIKKKWLRGYIKINNKEIMKEWSGRLVKKEETKRDFIKLGMLGFSYYKIGKVIKRKEEEGLINGWKRLDICRKYMWLNRIVRKKKGEMNELSVEIRDKKYWRYWMTGMSVLVLGGWNTLEYKGDSVIKEEDD